MRAASILCIVAFAAGCGHGTSAATPEVQVFDILSAYSTNPAAGDRQYRGKRIKVLVSEVAVRRRGEVKTSGDAFSKMLVDNDETIAVFAPARGDLNPARYAAFFFVSEAEAAKIQPRTQYAIAGECEGLSGNTVVFRGCTASELK